MRRHLLAFCKVTKYSDNAFNSTCFHCLFVWFFLEKNDIPFIDLVQRKTVLSHRMVMFPFAECTVHCLDSS